MNYRDNKLRLRDRTERIFVCAIAATILASAGCQSLLLRNNSAADDLILDGGIEQVSFADDPTAEGSGVVTAGATSIDGADSDVVQADGDAASYFEASGSENQLVGFLASLRENIPNAKKAYQRGDALFRKASNKPRALARRDFSKAAQYFESAGDSAPGSALQQDALFMQAESHFFANELNDATKAYQELQKEFPRNRHNDRVAARLFSISKYWIGASKAKSDAWYKINLFDSSRPSYDANGQAIKVLDQIRYDDPTGKLADDATMAAAVEYMRQREFEKADEFLTDLRKVFTDSDHMFMAHLLGIQCKLEIYSGPNYSGLVLEEARELIDQIRRRFPNEMNSPEYSELVARAARTVEFKQAERLTTRAKYRENKREFGAATELYRQVVENHPRAPQAKLARARLGDTTQKPAIPEQRLAWLTNIFPDSQQKSPLKLSGGKKPSSSNTSTMLR